MGSPLGKGEGIMTAEQTEYLFPVSFSQQRFCLLDRLAPENPAYNMPVAFTLKGPLDLVAVVRALKTIIDRHEILRTTFEEEEEQFCQVVRDQGKLALNILDLSGVEDPDSHARNLAHCEAVRGFDLATGPLLRVRILFLAPQSWVLLVTLHHSIADGWSVSVLVGEFSTLYRHFLIPGDMDDHTDPLPPLEIQYADYTVWQREWMQGERLDRALSHWRKTLKTAPQLLELPTDRPRPPRQTFRGKSVKFKVPASLSNRLKTLIARRPGVTPFMALLSAFGVLLQRYSGQLDLLIGSPIAGRRQKELEPLIGCFINTLVLRINLEGNPSFNDLLERVKKRALEAYQHQDLPFEKLVEALKPERSGAFPPLFQVMFTFQNAPNQDLNLPGARCSLVTSDQVTVQFDLALTAVDTGTCFQGALDFNTDLFDYATMETMVGNFIRLLDSICTSPQKPVAQLAMVDLEEWRGQQPYQAPLASPMETFSLHALIGRQVNADTHGPALTYGKTTLSYGQLNAAANRLAQVLQRQGVGPEVGVGLVTSRSIPLVVAMLAILKAGGYYVPLDPTYPANRLRHILDQTQPKLVLLPNRQLDATPFGSHNPQYFHHLVSLETSAGDPGEPHANVGRDNLAYLLFTSGSTGQPKGVMITHGAIVNFMLWIRQILPTETGYATLQRAPFSFDVSVSEVFSPLVRGARLVLPDDETAKDPKKLVALMATEGINEFQIVPSLLQEMIQIPQFANLTGLKRILCGAETLHPELRDRVLSILPVQLLNQYGPSEATIDATFHWCQPEASLLPIGWPLPGYRVYVLDPFLAPVPRGVTGQLFIAGAGLARGYRAATARTALQFLPDPFSEISGERMYASGDLVRVQPDGNLDFLGRCDHQIKWRGFRIEPGEIEACLEHHPGVQDSLVMLREVGGNDQLIAYIQPGETVSRSGEGDTLQAQLLQNLRAQLPGHLMPSQLVFLDRFPRHPNGKAKREAFPTPTPKRQTKRVPPTTMTQKMLAEIWGNLLGLDALCIHDNFFDQGGHSLLAMRVVSQLQRDYQREIPLGWLFEYPTIAGLAARMDKGTGTGERMMVPLTRADGGMPLFLVHGAEGQITPFYQLAGKLGRQQPLYAFQAPARHGNRTITLEEIATEYGREITAKNGSHPLVLGGWSAGGLIAFELARQLLQTAIPVAALVMFDTHLPVLFPEEKESPDVVLRHLATMAGYGQDRRQQLMRAYAPRVGAQESPPAGKEALDPGFLTRHLPEFEPGFVIQLWQTFATHVAATARYRPEPLPIPMHLLEPEQGGHSPPAGLQWQRLGLVPERHTVPGDHFTMWQDPHVHQLAHILTKVIASANQQPNPVMRDAPRSRPSEFIGGKI